MKWTWLHSQLDRAPLIPYQGRERERERERNYASLRQCQRTAIIHPREGVAVLLSKHPNVQLEQSLKFHVWSKLHISKRFWCNVLVKGSSTQMDKQFGNPRVVQVNWQCQLIFHYTNDMLNLQGCSATLSYTVCCAWLLRQLLKGFTVL